MLVWIVNGKQNPAVFGIYADGEELKSRHHHFTIKQGSIAFLTEPVKSKPRKRGG